MTMSRTLLVCNLSRTHWKFPDWFVRINISDRGNWLRFLFIISVISLDDDASGSAAASGKGDRSVGRENHNEGETLLQMWVTLHLVGCADRNLID